MNDVATEARDWIADDPDEQTRAELESVVAAAESGDAAALEDLRDRFSGLLEFGTAGLRGALGAGPARMNRVVVIRAAAGLTAYLQDTLGKRDVTVVIGYDARHNSDVFARDTAAVAVGAGGRAMILPHTLPTPVLAFMIRHLGADAGVMVTASHNPPQDNGYKVYLGDGSQIVAPADVRIADAISRFPKAADVPLADDGWETLADEVVDDYLTAVTRVVRPDGPRDINIVHTALHGVGSAVLRAAFDRAGFPAPESVADQAEPDPAFPTVAFPNPEEPGAIDHALALAAETSADLVIANDPDADRCAVAVPRPDGWAMLRGDEVGALLGAYLLQRDVARDAVFANSIVSSRLLAAMAKAAGVPHAETLTGFKWISRVPGLAYGYEEALGYCVDPEAVRDKDGISAALLVAEFAAQCKAEGRTLDDILAELAVQHGTHATDSFSVRVDDLSVIGDIMGRLRSNPPQSVAGQEVSQVDDLSLGAGGLPPTEGLRYFLADDTRVIVRPSGTEPKLKIYLETIDADPEVARRKLADVRAQFERLTAAR
ncbi:phosphomannomutase [Flexivirga endophytica]|uniref:Phosphomannomutase n=1 Tax=Flexivirga endophytica TaxID=1849103 RepID=A0A916TBC3_9MICO|nr:phospho-sugar mutase [Flexivirga endophytica]GGB38425.1 phosphomannomutase [Flexivirga endophytica]GHB46422.1 phosphomannomutase [Flexivirga endophytica]